MHDLMRKLAIAALTFLCATSMRAQQSWHYVPTIPQSNYDWIPDCSNEDSPPLPPGRHTLHRTSADNDGTPWVHDAPPDTRKGHTEDNGINYDYNSGSIFANGYLWSVAEDKPGEVVQPIPTGAVSITDHYTRIRAWRINPATAAIVAGPITLDGHAADCSLPRILNAAGNDFYVLWKEHIDGTGDRILVTYYNGAFAAPVPVSGTTYYPDIREYSAAVDASGNIGVVIRVNYGTRDDRIFTQCLSPALIPQWNLAGWLPMRQIGGYGLGPGGSPVHASGKYNPLIVWNNVKTRFEYAWGDHYYEYDPSFTKDVMVVQTEDAPWGGGSATENFSSGGLPVLSHDLFRDRPGHNYEFEFCMAPCKGWQYTGGSDVGETVFLWTDSLGNVKMGGQLLDGPTAVITFTRTLVAGHGHWCYDFAGIPSAIATLQVSATRQDPVGIWTGGCAEATWAARLDNTTGSYTTSWPAPTYSASAYEQEPFGFAGINSDGIYAAASGENNVWVYRIDPTSGTFTHTQILLGRTQTDGDAVYSFAIESSTIGVFNFDYGGIFDPEIYYLGGLYGPFHTGVAPFGDAMMNSQTDEPMREQSTPPNTAYKVFTCSTSTSSLSNLASSTIEQPIIQHDPHTAVCDNHRTTAFEQLDENGITNIMLAVDNAGAALNLTNSTGSTWYFQPKVGVVFNGTSYIAIVTFIEEVPGSAAANYCYTVVDLSTMTASPISVIAAGASLDFRNWDVTFDPINQAHIFFFSQFCSAFPNDISAVGFDNTGTPLLWGVQTVEPTTSYTGTWKDQVRACYNPDPANPGAYVVWRETPLTSGHLGDKAGIGLSEISTAAGAIWPIGTYMHCVASINHRGEPVACASANWVYMAWDDQGSFGPPAPTQIYGAAHDNTGTLLPGSAINGTLTSAPFCGQTAATTEAMYPDAVALGTNYAVVAFQTDDDPSGTNRLTPRFVGVGNVGVNPYTPLVGGCGGTPTEFSMQFGPTLPPGFAATDAEMSLFGFAQRHPKLRLIQDTMIWHYEMALPFAVLVAFETEPYNMMLGSHPYTDIWNVEMEHRSSGDPEWSQNNIVARLIDPTNPPMMFLAQFSLARNTGAQDLQGIYYTPQLGMMATFTDYTNTDGHEGIIKNVDIDPYIMYAPNSTSIPSTNTGGTWPGPGLSTYNTLNPIVYNTSWVPLTIHPDVASSTAGFGTIKNYWAVPPTMQVAPRATATIPITYQRNLAVTPPVDLQLVAYGDLVYRLPGAPPPFCFNDLFQYMENTGAGLKRSSDDEHSLKTGELALSLKTNPALDRTTLVLMGLQERIVSIAIMNPLGQIATQLTPVSGSNSGVEIPLDVSAWPSGNYIVEAVGDEGSRSHVLLSVRH